MKLSKLISGVGLFGYLCVGVSFAAHDEATKVQAEKTFEKKLNGMDIRLQYLLSLPQGYEQGDKHWPLVLFLHGSGESGTDLQKVKKHGPPMLVEKKKDFPFILVSPQSRGGGPGRGWNPAALNGLLDEIEAHYRVDKDRIYVTGLSMGGFGAWALAASAPNRFAAIVPICGGGNPKDAEKLAHLPIWVFHGGKDNVVPPARSEEMVNALKAKGSNVKLTIYPEAGHDSWTKTYDDSEMWKWLLEQKRSPK